MPIVLSPLCVGRLQQELALSPRGPWREVFTRVYSTPDRERDKLFIRQDPYLDFILLSR